MFKQKFNWLVNLVMLPTAIWVSATGIVAELFDINDFVLHKYPAFGLAVLLAIHFFLRLTQWLSGTRRLFTVRSTHPFKSPSPATAPPVPARVTRRNVLIWLGSAMGGFLIGNFLAPTRRANLPTDEDIGVVYHHWSKPGNVSLISAVIDWGTQPPVFKEYPGVAKIPLPPIVRRDSMAIEQAIAQRRSVRDYADRALQLDELNRLLHYTTGINDSRWGSGLRSTPSSGALYPVETYLVIHAVEGVARGIYHYNVRDHALEQMRAGDFRQSITDAALGQEFFGKAGVVFVLTGVFQRARWKYQDRAYRYTMLEAGHIGQNIYLVATALGLGACAVGAFWDNEVNQLIQVDGKQEATLYLLTVGRM